MVTTNRILMGKNLCNENIIQIVFGGSAIYYFCYTLNNIPCQ